MDEVAISQEIQKAAANEDTAALFQIAKGLLAGKVANDKKMHRLVEIGRPAVGFEEEWNNTIMGITG